MSFIYLSRKGTCGEELKKITFRAFCKDLPVTALCTRLCPKRLHVPATPSSPGPALCFHQALSPSHHDWLYPTLKWASYFSLSILGHSAKSSSSNIWTAATISEGFHHTPRSKDHNAGWGRQSQDLGCLGRHNVFDSITTSAVSSTMSITSWQLCNCSIFFNIFSNTKVSCSSCEGTRACISLYYSWDQVQ